MTMSAQAPGMHRRRWAAYSTWVSCLKGGAGRLWYMRFTAAPVLAAGVHLPLELLIAGVGFIVAYMPPRPSTSLGCPSTAREPRIVHGEPSRHLVSWVASVGILVSVSQPAVASGSRRCRMTMFSLESCGANPEKMLVARKETSQSQRNECQEAPVSNNGRARSGVCAAHTGPFYYSPLQL